MTSYSVHCTNGLAPDFSTINYLREENFIAGACRAVLDFARHNDMGEMEGPTVYATDYDCGNFGWERDAIGDGRTDLLTRLRAFLAEHSPAVAAFADAFAADRYAPPRVAGNADMAWYEAGYLYVCSANGEGVGMWEYAGDVGRRLSDLAAKQGDIHAAAYRDEPVVEMVSV